MLIATILLGVVASSFAQQCGKKGSSTRIIGGVNAGHGEFPWQVSLRYHGDGNGERHICGGTLLSKRWVLCAAHCFGGSKKPNDFKIRTGEWHLDSDDKTERDFNVKNIIVHKLFNRPQRFANDIALLELSEDADLNDVYVGTACLPPSGKDYRGHKDCFLSGWGLIERRPPRRANQLQKVAGKIWTARAAAITWGQMMPDKTVAFGRPGKWSACMGDSGGPLVCGNGNGGFDVIGVVSFGPSSCGGMPGVFTEVSQFIDWITHNAGQI